MEWRVPLSDVNFDGAEARAAKAVIDSGWLSNGPCVAEFERVWAEAHESPRAVGVSNATAALHLACIAAGFGPGDEVLCPALTFVATANAIRYVGAKPVLVDIASPAHPLAGVEQYEAAYTPRVKGVMLVHYAGYAADAEAVREWCEAKGLVLIEDAAHAPLLKLEAGLFAGAFGLAGCFSFFPNKNMTTGEGGMLICRDPEVAELARSLRSHGMTTQTRQRHEAKAMSYDVEGLGFNYRMDEIRAAIGLEQLKKLPDANRRRAELAERYRELLRDCAEVELPFLKDRPLSVNHVFPVLLRNADGERRDETRNRMHQRGVQTSVHYPPIHWFSAYREIAAGVRLPQTEDYVDREITLPLYPDMTAEQQILVVETLREALV